MIIKQDTSIVPIFTLPAVTAVFSDPDISLDLYNAFLIGLYNSIVIAALRPPLSKLKGKNAGIKSLATASRGSPI